MSDRKQALQDLLAKIEAGEDFHQFGWGDFTEAFPATEIEEGLWEDCQHEWALGAYNGSLDAAKALHEAVAPDAWVNIDASLSNTRTAVVFVENENGTWQGQGETPARTWLIALLKLLIAEAGT